MKPCPNFKNVFFKLLSQQYVAQLQKSTGASQTVTRFSKEPTKLMKCDELAGKITREETQLFYYRSRKVRHNFSTFLSGC